MANSYTNIITFLLTTIFYYLALKPKLTFDILDNPEEYKKYTKNNYLYLGIYFLLVIVIQAMVNVSIITSTCGGAINENIGAAGALTFFPWLLIFGVIIIVLIAFPGFKGAFSDVIGYFYVSGNASKTITTLLMNKDVEKSLTSGGSEKIEIPSMPPSSPSLQTGGGDDVSPTERKKIEDAADTIIKICGNTSILINQIVPENFKEYWQILQPLLKADYRVGSPSFNEGETIKRRNELFDLVVTRDNVGEAIWYVYTGILLVSIVQLKITTRGCITNPATMEKNFDNYKEKQAQVTKEQDLATSTTYTITN